MPGLDLFARSLVTPDNEKLIVKYQIGKTEGTMELASDIKYFDRARKENLKKLLRYLEKFVIEVEYTIKTKIK